MCRHVSIWGFKKCVCLSVPLEKKSSWLHQYQSYISDWCINGKIFTSSYYRIKTQNLIFFPKKFKIDRIELYPYPDCPYPEKRNHPGFVNISPTFVIDTSMKNSSSSTASKHKKKFNYFFFKKVQNWIWFVPKSWNHLSFVNISPTLVIDISMERYSQVLATTWKPKKIYFLLKSLKLNFALCWRAEINIQVGLNMHLYDNIGDASLSVGGLMTSLLRQNYRYS